MAGKRILSRQSAACPDSIGDGSSFNLISYNCNNSQKHEVGSELADILIYLCAIANRYDIDLETAFREKEEINKKRIWA